MSDNFLPTEAKKTFSLKKPDIDWRKVCRVMLDCSLPTNPLSTQPDGLEREDDNLNISLGLVGQQRQQPRSSNIWLETDELSSPDRKEHIAKTYRQEEFFEQVLQGKKSTSQGQKIAIAGESGTGKTTLLEKIANWVLEKTEDVPIWITPSQLGTNLFDRYLHQKWLPQAAKGKDIPTIEWQEAFEELLDSGRVWLLIDGADERLLKLIAIAQQIRSWMDKVRIVLTCRTLIWEENQDSLVGFDTYQTLALSYPEQVRKFIQKWFNPANSAPERQEASENIGEKLFQILDRPEKVQIRQAIANPLRLALLCRLWQQQPQELPNTKAELYRRLIPEFYQWKAEATTTNAEQQQKLNEALGNLALRSMQQTKSFPHHISHRLVYEVLGEDTPLLRLAVRLGWLQPMGVFTENPQEKYYTFFDPTFQEYFAACGVEDWHFFLERKLEKDKPLDAKYNGYRIFESHWHQTILLWLGREDVTKQAKEAFIKELVEFNDGCGYENFYGKHAYFLAAAALSEFSQCDRADEIVEQIVDWSFGELDDCYQFQNVLNHPIALAARATLSQTDRSKAIALLVRLIGTTEDEEAQEIAFRSLAQIGDRHREAIAALEQILTEERLESIRWQIAACLGTIDPGNQKAIAALVQMLAPGNPEDVRQIAFDSLETVGRGNQKAIAALINLLRTTDSSAAQRRAFECLATIGRGNRTAIATIVQLIRTNEDEGTRRQAAETLEKIDPGNPTGIAVLVQLLYSARQEEIRKQAVYSLGEIDDPGNGEAIAALVKLLETAEDVFMRWVAVSSLGKIGIGDRDAIDAIVKIIKAPDQGLLRKEAIDSLEKISPNHPVALAALVRLMQYADDEGIRREAAESLGKIDPANPTAIAALEYLLRTSYDEFTCRQAAYSLGKIDPGNPEAIKALVKLIQLSRDKDIRSLAAESLGEIGANNPVAIATSIRLLQSAKDKDTIRQAAKSLGKIGKGNRDAISVLLGLLQSSDDETIRLQIADSLIHLLQDRQMMLVISTLRDGFLYKSTTPDMACYSVMWHCAQRLPYPEFYQAWYFRPLPVQPEIAEAPETEELDFEEVISNDETSQTNSADDSSLASRLHQAIIDHPELSTFVHLVCIDSSQFIDPDNPLIDIYDQMLAQNCPKFEYGVPDSMAKLRLYWNMLRRNYTDKTFVLLFDENCPIANRQGFSPSFLNVLSKFEGSICVVTDQNPIELKQFSPRDPQLDRAIVDWIEAQSHNMSADENV